jgi:hypothetical protein
VEAAGSRQDRARKKKKKKKKKKMHLSVDL